MLTLLLGDSCFSQPPTAYLLSQQRPCSCAVVITSLLPLESCQDSQRFHFMNPDGMNSQ